MEAMAKPVLVEAISVIIRLKTIEEKYPGGWDGFADDAPNYTLCADDDIARIGFMVPADVKSFVERLENIGFVFLEEGRFIDIAIIDQHIGFTEPCDWLEVAQARLPNTTGWCYICRQIGCTSNKIAIPEGWEYEGSLSQSNELVIDPENDPKLKFLRHENGLDVYLDLLTGKERYVGRAS